MELQSSRYVCKSLSFPFLYPFFSISRSTRHWRMDSVYRRAWGAGFQNDDVEEEKASVLIFLAQVATHAFHLTTPDSESEMITASDMKIYRLQLCFALCFRHLSTFRHGPRAPTWSHGSNFSFTPRCVFDCQSAILPDAPSVAVAVSTALIGIYPVTVGYILAYSTPLGPPLHCPPSDTYSSVMNGWEMEVRPWRPYPNDHDVQANYKHPNLEVVSDVTVQDGST